MAQSSADDSGEPIKSAYWTAFGYQNHVITEEDVRTEGQTLIALCGVMAEPEDLSPVDDRPTCSVCAAEARSGRIVLAFRDVR
ncbi:hypothetical protein SAMN05421805_12011 [Saccharopolyspora antimicrobica]|uniref:Uncharacterized protein n=1 Tax=Saccharopolyspora antimicrobica TaxID=455193 RepID=A0A1I5IW69_9PSEU|nr:hypothetical protein ATL45_2019 [Saccharopolyspora antimicrobica]SFO64580.1 hypothetical protein SAMN05421805_12011 [Saccharopolyspora antimicrobica]